MSYTKRRRERGERLRKKKENAERSKNEFLVPKLWVGREKLLEEDIALRKKEAEEEAEKVTLKKLWKQVEKLERELNVTGTNSHNLKQQANQAGGEDRKKLHRTRYHQNELNSLLSKCDIVVLVLDARDPTGCRCKQLEERVTSMKTVKGNTSKKLVLLLNKIDLIPPEVLSVWIKYLRLEYPVVAFKAAFKEKKKTPGRSTNPLIGMDALVALVMNYRQTFKVWKPTSVGFVGYPNVGKSSIINSLKRYRAVLTSSTPGSTQNLNKLRLDTDITLIDSPGIILNTDDYDVDLFLKNIQELEGIDAIEVVNNIVSRLDPNRLRKFYRIPAFQDGEGFLLQIAKIRTCANSDGLYNLKAVARLVLQEWNIGKIKYYVIPPESIEKLGELEAKFIQDWGKDQDINNIINVNLEQALAKMKTTGYTKNFIPLSAPS